MKKWERQNQKKTKIFLLRICLVYMCAEHKWYYQQEKFIFLTNHILLFEWSFEYIFFSLFSLLYFFFLLHFTFPTAAGCLLATKKIFQTNSEYLIQFKSHMCSVNICRLLTYKFPMYTLCHFTLFLFIFLSFYFYFTFIQSFSLFHTTNNERNSDDEKQFSGCTKKKKKQNKKKVIIFTVHRWKYFRWNTK